jgi:hypothetical protein
MAPGDKADEAKGDKAIVTAPENTTEHLTASSGAGKGTLPSGPSGGGLAPSASPTNQQMSLASPPYGPTQKASSVERVIDTVASGAGGVGGGLLGAGGGAVAGFLVGGPAGAGIGFLFGLALGSVGGAAGLRKLNSRLNKP